MDMFIKPFMKIAKLVLNISRISSFIVTKPNKKKKKGERASGAAETIV